MVNINHDFQESQEYPLGMVKYRCTVTASPSMFGDFRWQTTDTSTGEFRGGFAVSTEQAWQRAKFARYEMHEAIYS